jgi:hypothetical protein
MSETSGMGHVDTLPPLDSEALAFDVSRETRRTVVDLIRESKPTTILGVLLANREQGVTVEAIAKDLEDSIGLVSWNVKKLELEDLCVRVEIDGDIRVLPVASYTERNE